MVEQVRHQERLRARYIREAMKDVTETFKRMRSAWIRKAHSNHWNDIRPEWHAAKARLYKALGQNYAEYSALLNKLVLDAGLKWIVDYRPEQLTLQYGTGPS